MFNFDLSASLRQNGRFWPCSVKIMVRLRELLIKNAALLWTSSKRGGGGSEAIQKFWDTFCVKDFVKGLLGHFSRKCPKSSKSLGGGVRPFWKKSIIKLDFFYEKLPKIEKLGTWQNSMWFRNLWPFSFVLYQGTLGLLLMALKCNQSWRHHIYQAISMNGPTL